MNKKTSCLCLYIDQTVCFILQWILPGAVASESTCPYAFYLSDDGICCQKCFPGTKQIKVFSITFVSQASPLPHEKRLVPLVKILARFFTLAHWRCSLFFLGYRVVANCHASGQPATCEPCQAGQYMDAINFSENCRGCSVCKGKTA